MLSTDQLMLFLSDSGIVSTQRLRVFQEHLRRRKHDVESLDALTRELVQAGLITEFQAEEIGHGQGSNLVFGNYVLIDRVGRGGMGEVYRARHTLMNREVAIKFLGAPAVDKIGSIRRFRREVRAAAKLIHPNIVTALDAGEREGVCFLVMELVHGATLAQHVHRGGPLTIPKALELTRQVAEALAYAHSRGVIHRDIKPGNLILSDQGTVKLLDLGLSQLRNSPESAAAHQQSETGATEQQLTGLGHFMGTIDFMAPEQAIDPHEVDQRADVYSLGCTLYFLLTGQPPFPGKTVLERLLAHRDGAIPMLRDSRPEAPPQLEALVLGMLGKSANQRLQCMEDVIAQLKECQRELGDPPSDVPVTMLFTPEGASSKGLAKRSPWIVAGLLVLAFGLMAWWRPWTPPQSAGESPSAGQSAPPVLAGPVDLLPLIDVERDRLNGDDWKLEDGRLVTASESPSVLTLNHPVPADYSLEIAGHRLTGTGPLVVGLVVGERECYALLDASRPEGSQFAIGTNAEGNLVRKRYREPLFVPDEPFQIRCVVRATAPAMIEVTSNGEVLVEWTGNPAELELGAGWAGVPGQLFLGTNNESSFSIDRLVVAPLTERSPGDPGSDAEIRQSTASPET